MLNPRRIIAGGLLPTLALLIACENAPTGPVSRASRVISSSAGTLAVAVSESRIDVRWLDDASNESGFELYRSTTGSIGPFALLAILPANVTTFADADLASSTEYCYRVRWFRPKGSRTWFSSFANVACATTLGPVAPPESPTGVVPIPEGYWMGVAWTDQSASEDGFRIERSTDGATWATVSITGADVTRGDDYEAPEEQDVCYRIIAFNERGDSPPSETACALLPANPDGLAFTTVDSTTSELTWTDNSSFEDGYRVEGLYCDMGAGEPYRTVVQTAAGVTSARVTVAQLEAALGPPLGPSFGEDPIGVYTLHVVALKGSQGYSAPSEPVYVTPYSYGYCDGYAG